MKKIILDGHEIEISDERYEELKKEFIKEEIGRAKKDKEYWYIDSCGYICVCCDYYDYYDDYHFKMGNYYLTEEECERAKKVQNILLKYRYRFTKEKLEEVTNENKN